MHPQIQAILARAHHPRRSVRNTTPEALRGLAPLWRQRALLRLLASGDAEVREMAMEVAVEEAQKAPDFVPDLLLHLRKLIDTNADPGILQITVLTLRLSLATAADDTPDSPPNDTQRTFAACLGELANHPDPDVRFQCISARESLNEAGQAYGDYLLAALLDPDHEVRIIATQGLTRLASTQALPALREATSRAHGHERFHFVIARASLGEEELVEALMAALPNPDLRFAAIIALGDYGHPAAIPALRDIFQARLGERLHRIAAARSALLLGDSQAYAFLLDRAHRRNLEAGYAIEALCTCVNAKSSDAPFRPPLDEILTHLDAIARDQAHPRRQSAAEAADALRSQRPSA